MPVSQIDIAKNLIAAEKHLPTADLIILWTGRRDSAQAWAAECQRELDRLYGRSQLEMNVIVEAAAPPEGGS